MISTSKPKTIVYLVRQTAGGMQNHLLALVSNFKNKYRIDVIAPSNPKLAEKLAALNVPFYQVPIADNLKPLADLSSAFQIRKLLKQLKPDIFHIHGNKTALVGRLALLGKKSPPTVVTVHNFLIFQQAPFPLKQLAASLERFLMRKTTQLITVSEQLKTALVKDERLPAAKIKVIHNGLDLSNWQTLNKEEIRQKLGLEKETFVILTVGRLVAWKGHRFLINALNNPPLNAEENVKLLIAGDGPLKEELAQLIAKQGLTAKITLLGYATNVPELMTAADLFVLPSLNEPFGLVLLEAMAAKLPIIATNNGGVPEIITHQQTGWLVPPQDAPALAAAICRLKSDAQLRATLALNAWQELNNRFSLTEMLAKTEKVYEECLSGEQKAKILVAAEAKDRKGA